MAQIIFTSAQNNKKIRVALTSIVAALFLTVIKLAVGLMTNSLGILAEALHSALDMVAAIITFIAVYFSKNPADLDHNFGHGKIENFSALVETLILIITCGWIIIEAIERITHKVAPEVNFLSFAVIIIAIIVDYERSRLLYRVAKETRSQALEADALHFSTDILSSFVVILGLIFVSIGFPIGDAIAALAVAVIVAWISVKLGLSTINALMDKVPLEQYNIIQSFIKSEFPAYEIKRLRLRESGPSIMGDLTVEIPAEMNMNDFHTFRDYMHSKLHVLVPHLDLMITAHPKEVEIDNQILTTKSIQRTINSIKINKIENFEIHNLTYYKNHGKNKIDFHLVLPNNLTLSEAHQISEQFKKDIKILIPQLDEIICHLEPLNRSKKFFIEKGFDKELLSNKIEIILSSITEILSIISIDISIHKGRYIIILGISLNGSLNLDEAHEITYKVEAKLFENIANIDKILVHTQPENLSE